MSSTDTRSPTRVEHEAAIWHLVHPAPLVFWSELTPGGVGAPGVAYCREGTFSDRRRAAAGTGRSRDGVTG